MRSPLPRIRRLCLGFPEAHEVEAWGAPTFRVRNKLFVMFADKADHHGGGRYAIWVKAAKDNQQLMMRAEPDRYFSPPYVGPSGWIGAWLDENTDWDMVKELVRDAYCRTAPRKLAALVTDRASSP